MPQTLSAIVISFNRAALIGTCLRALAFADEVIVVDKSSTDATAQIATQYADRVITVPWTPTVEDTRAFAIAQSTGAWVLCLDDDECLGPGAGAAIRAELDAPRADIYYLPLRHYILGIHDETAYYWPEHHPRLFRRGAVAFTATVHGGMQLCSDHVVRLPPDSGAVIHHLSHRDVAEWIDKCNRYTSRPDRRSADDGGCDLARFAHARIDHWQTSSRVTSPDDYPAAVALLRATYDIVDRLKLWEQERGVDGAMAFEAVCDRLDKAYAALPPSAGRCGAVSRDDAPPPGADGGADVATVLRRRIAELRAQNDAAATGLARLQGEAERWQGEAERWQGEAARWQEEAARHAETATSWQGAAEAAACEARQRREEAAHQRQEVARRRQEVAREQQTVARLERKVAEARDEGRRAQLALATQQARSEALLEHADGLRQRLAAIERSTCWRATAGARRVAERAKRLARR